MTTETTVPPTPLLEIRVTQTDGVVTRFAQDDPALVRGILEGISPSRLFSVPHLLLGGDGALSVFASVRVERVELIGTGLPAWPYLGGATAVRELTEETFRASYDPARSAADRRMAGAEPGTPQAGFTEFWTVSGRRLFWEVQVASRPMMRTDLGPYIQSLFGAGGLHARTGNGSVAILNPAAITHMVFHPGPPVLPLKAWPVRRL